MENIIYFNNAATTWPKPDTVKEAVSGWFKMPPINSSRHCNCIKKQDDVDVECKRIIAEFFNVDRNKYDIIITPGCTYSINTVINYLYKFGYSKIVCDSNNHNSIYRTHYEKINKKPCMLDNCRYVVREDIKEDWYMALTHVNNVDGSIMDIKSMLNFLVDNNIHNPVILDVTQSAGTFDIDITDLNYDNLYVVCSGHKGLYSTTGIGFLIAPKNRITIPFVSGGTGGHNSMDYEHTNSLEAGTPNELSMRSLIAGIQYIQKMGLDHFKISKRLLVEFFIEQWNIFVEKRPEIQNYFELCENKNPEAGIICLKIKDELQCKTIIEKIQKDYSIIVRSGVHCSPLYHVNVLRCNSTLRLSFSPYNQKSEINKFFDALEHIVF